MRVLLIPEFYRPDEPSANGTLADARTWVERWLDRDDGLHVYWLVRPDVPDDALLEDHERVTAISAEPFAADTDFESLFTEGGYSAAELAAIRGEIFDRGAYLDAVVDQRRTGRFTLSKWLRAQTDHWAADVDPVDIIVNVHDLQVPRKFRYCDHRDAFQGRMEIASAALADGIWFKAGVDARRLREHATDFLRADVVEAALAGAVDTGSPIPFDAFDPEFADSPDTLHLAGSLWDKKCADRLLAVGERLHEAHGVETLLTSVDPIPAGFRAPDWVTARPEADRETYENALDRGDIAVCASEYETMARTPFEQLASGQVLVVRDEHWIRDCVPDDYPLAGPVDALADLAAAAIEHWPAAVGSARDLLAHVERVRDPDRSARRTYDDLVLRVAAKTASYELCPADDPVRAALSRVALAGGERDPRERSARERDEPNLHERESSVALGELEAETATHTADGHPITDHDDYALADLVYALRSLGYRDAGNPGMPIFVPLSRA